MKISLEEYIAGLRRTSTYLQQNPKTVKGIFAVVQKLIPLAPDGYPLRHFLYCALPRVPRHYIEEGLIKQGFMEPDYSATVPADAQTIDVNVFLRECGQGFYLDDDGYGLPINKKGMMAQYRNIYPSALHKIPVSATRIAWFNR